MKNILVLIHDDPGQEARLQAALDVARAVEGHLTCVEALFGGVTRRMLTDSPIPLFLAH